MTNEQGLIERIEGEGWQTMDDWCVKRMEGLSEQMNPYIMAGGSLEDPQYRAQLGEHRGYMAMRSFIHGHRNQTNGDPQHG